jgi:hypothetical protein
MKMIAGIVLAVMLALSAPAFAAKIVSDSTDYAGTPPISHCAWYMDASPRQLVPAPVDEEGQPYCMLPIDTLAVGAHKVQAAFVVGGTTTNPEKEGPKSEPLNFTQPAPPSKPTGLVIKP